MLYDLNGVSMLYYLDRVSMLYDLRRVSMLYYLDRVSMLYDLRRVSMRCCNYNGVSMLYDLRRVSILFGFTSCVHSDGSRYTAWVATHAIPFHYNIAHRLQLRVSQWVFPAAVFFLK